MTGHVARPVSQICDRQLRAAIGLLAAESGEVAVATDVAEQVVTPAGRLGVSVGVPILASVITAAGVPDWAVQRPRISKLIAEDGALTSPGAGGF